MSNSPFPPWRDIKTDPPSQEFERIIVYDREYGATTAYFSEEYFFKTPYAYFLDPVPNHLILELEGVTHWMPLPSDPEEDEENEN